MADENRLTDPVVRIRGLPFSATETDVIEFFKGVEVSEGTKGVTFTFGRDGRATGEAYVLLASMNDAQKALEFQRKNMGKRYIEELNYFTGKTANSDDFVVRLRGLPYDVDKAEIMTFFDGLEIAPNGIGLLLDNMGRSTGEAFVQFTSAEMLEKARSKHMQKIGHRYIEIFKSNMIEANNAIKRQMNVNQGTLLSDLDYEQPSYRPRLPPRGPPSSYRVSPYPRPFYGPGHYAVPSNAMRGNVKSAFGPEKGLQPGESYQSTTGHAVHMRGLPFDAVEEDIREFFAPLEPVHIELHVLQNGRAAGEADVDFASHDEAKEGMKKDRETMGRRYIELFLNSSPISVCRTFSPKDAAAAGNAPVPLGAVKRSSALAKVGISQKDPYADWPAVLPAHEAHYYGYEIADARRGYYAPLPGLYPPGPPRGAYGHRYDPY